MATTKRIQPYIELGAARALRTRSNRRPGTGVAAHWFIQHAERPGKGEDSICFAHSSRLGVANS
jgi:hypothetical protein